MHHQGTAMCGCVCGLWGAGRDAELRIATAQGAGPVLEEEGEEAAPKTWVVLGVGGLPRERKQGREAGIGDHAGVQLQEKADGYRGRALDFGIAVAVPIQIPGGCSRGEIDRYG